MSFPRLSALGLSLVLALPALAFAQSAPATGTVTAVDAAKSVITLSHGPIPALGWPAMTMAFGTAPAVDLNRVKAGDTVAFTVAKTPEGFFLIDAIKTVK
ncbi:MAG: copper-binding protein [Rhodospirillaceae bacterium]